MQLQLESLCDRTVPSTLTVVGTEAADTVSINPSPVGISVTVNGVATDYCDVDGVVVFAKGGADDIENNTSVNLTAFGGAGDDTIFGGTGLNVIDAGAGKDVVYSLVGPTVVNADDGQADRVYVSDGAAVNADKKDQVVTFFADGRVPNSGQFGLVDGVLYLTPPAGGSVTFVNEAKGQVVVTTDWAGVLTFKKSDVDVLAYFGGSGDDVLVNGTKVEQVSYGAAGDDVLVSGDGAFNLMKGSGGDDVLVANGKRADVSGNGGSDIIVVNAKKSKLRLDAFDTVIR